MATIPGAVVIPQHYHSTMVLYSAVERVEAVVDGAPPGPLGRLFVVEPGKAVKVPYEAGRFILEHYGYTGVVKVEETETETGVSYAVEAAKEASLAALSAEDERRFRIYVSSAIEDYVSRNKPVPPPPPTILALIKRRNYDLKKFGIVPLGWEAPEKDGRVAQLEAQNTVLQATLSKLQAQLDLLAGIEAKRGRIQ